MSSLIGHIPDPALLVMLLLDLLPSDVQIDILQTWVGTALSSLSALDVAFCSRSLRPDFLTLMTQAYRHQALSNGLKLSDLLGLVRWRVARGFAPIDLRMSCRAVMPTTSVVGGYYSAAWPYGHGNIAGHEVQEALLCCVNAEHVLYYHVQPSLVNGSNAHLSQANDDILLGALASVSLRKLATLVISTYLPLNLELMAAALLAVGPSLLELDLTVRTNDLDRLVNLIAANCIVLRHFGYGRPFSPMAPISLKAEHLSRLFAAIPSLVSLKFGRNQRIRILDISNTFHQLSSLQVYCRDEQFGFDEFVSLLERFPLLSVLKWNINEVCRGGNNVLKLNTTTTTSTTTALDSTLWARLFVVCPAVETLHLSLALVRGNETAMARIGEAYGATVTSLELHSVEPDDLLAIDTLLRFCPTLISIRIYSDTLSCSPATLRIIGLHCRLLTEISLCRMEASDIAEDLQTMISDCDIEQLCISCPKLTALRMSGRANISPATFNTIIRLKMRFRSLEFEAGAMSSGQADVQVFKEQLKEQGLVPVPHILIREEDNDDTGDWLMMLE